MTRSGRWLALLLLGMVLVQAAWLTLMPPYSGMDEIQHTYRAAAVAHGHVLADAPRAWVKASDGDPVQVPSAIVRAARSACDSLPYLSAATCVGRPDGSVTVVASTAARYNPAYYAVVGVAALPFHGAWYSYALRIATMLLCDGLLLLAFGLALRRGRTAWPAVALVVAGTPVYWCATANAAPNGVELAGALLLWTAVGAAVADDYAGRIVTPGTLRLATLGACVILLTHSLGPAWIACAAVVVSLFISRVGLLALWRTRRGTLLRCGGVLAAVGLGCVAWTLLERTNDPGTVAPYLDRPGPGYFAVQPVLWTLQTVGSVPFRNDPAPMPVFVISLGLFGALLAIAWRAAGAGVRRGWLLAAAVFLLAPLGLTWATYPRLGGAWQGRYALPLALAIPVVAGWVLERRPLQRRTEDALCLAVSVVGIGLCESLTLAALRLHPRVPQTATSPIHPAVWVMVVLPLLASVAIGLGLVRARHSAGATTLAPTSRPRVREVLA